jgi:hypothetical protein
MNYVTLSVTATNGRGKSQDSVADWQDDVKSKAPFKEASIGIRSEPRIHQSKTTFARRYNAGSSLR